MMDLVIGRLELMNNIFNAIVYELLALLSSR